MRCTVLAISLALCLAASTGARAQPSAAPPGPGPQQAQGDTILGMSKEQVFVVGAGIVVGALVVHLVIPADFTYFAGGVAGGLVANWWYHNGGEEKVRAFIKEAPSAKRTAIAARDGQLRLAPIALRD
jgi:hypothetical protein